MTRSSARNEKLFRIQNSEFGGQESRTPNSRGDWRSAVLVAIAKPILTLFVRLVGMQVRDARTGKGLGKYLFIPWRGRILVFGLGTANDEPFYPVFLPQKRLTYTLQELGFQQHPKPDFPNERDAHYLAHAPTGNERSANG
jgi:hypothetical protein